jgi:nitrogen PTS system EIIA component
MLHDLIPAAATFNRILLPSRDALLARLSDNAASLFGLHGDQVFEAAMAREAQGGTGVGDGIAIPHARVWGLPGPRALLATLASPLHFEGPDQRPADLVIFLLSPDVRGSEHIKSLARLARTLRKPGLVPALRSATSDAALYGLIGQWSPFASNAAPVPVNTTRASH